VVPGGVSLLREFAIYVPLLIGKSEKGVD